MLVSSLITSIRYKVGDIKATKWDDTRIIELLNEGLEDIASKIPVKKVRTSLPVVPYQRELVIPDENLVTILRVIIDGKKIPIITFDKLDDYSGWENDTGEVLKAVVYDKQNKGILLLYPLLTEASTDYDALNTSDGIVIDIPNVDRDYLEGIITSVETIDVVEPDNVYLAEEEYGTYTEITDLFTIVTIIYSSIPTTILTVDDDIDIDKLYFSTLKYYVSGMLLIDDTRSESITKGSLFIDKYKKDLENSRDNNAISYNEANSLGTNYRTGF